jgi:hypothetical protein
MQGKGRRSLPAGTLTKRLLDKSRCTTLANELSQGPLGTKVKKLEARERRFKEYHWLPLRHLSLPAFAGCPCLRVSLSSVLSIKSSWMSSIPELRTSRETRLSAKKSQARNMRGSRSSMTCAERLLMERAQHHRGQRTRWERFLKTYSGT